jgi:hypothetical protein
MKSKAIKWDEMKWEWDWDWIGLDWIEIDIE